MWKFKYDDGTELIGDRRKIKEELNIFMVWLGDREEEFDYHRESHWKRIVEEYGLTGND